MTIHATSPAASHIPEHNAQVPRGKAHGVVKKLGTGHYKPDVEAKLTAKFGHHLPPPVTDETAITPSTGEPKEGGEESSNDVVNGEVVDIVDIDLLAVPADGAATTEQTAPLSTGDKIVVDLSSLGRVLDVSA